MKKFVKSSKHFFYILNVNLDDGLLARWNFVFQWGDVNTRRMSLVSVILLCDSNTDENRFDKNMKEIWVLRGE